MSYIGNSPGNASQRVVTRKVATAGQTRFASDSGYATGYVDVIVNGSDLVAGVDFNETGDGINIDLVEACAADDNVKIVAYIPRGLSDGYTKPEANTLLALKADLVAGKIPSSQLPAYVDDVLEYADLAAFPATGSAGIIYVAQDTNNCYRWSGSAYIVLTDLSSYYTKTQTDAKYVGKDSSTGAALMPVGTTAQRPATPTSGMFRMNSTTGYPEWYDPVFGSWVKFNQGAPYTVEYLVVAGGGGGGNRFGGGGGGGGLRQSTESSVTPGTNFTITVGAGGAGGQSNNTPGSDGSNSSAFGITATGGGGGSSESSGGGRSGGSGGGGSFTPGSQPGGSGTSGQGNAGGTGIISPRVNGGGGGASAAGVGNGSRSDGGAGTNWLSLGMTYAGGGGGADNRIDSAGFGGPEAGYGGAGGGGRGGGGEGNGQADGRSGVGENGTANLGGGGGGGAYIPSIGGGRNGGSGGSGVVVVRYQGPQRGIGGTVTNVGGYTYHTFTASGTFTA